MDSDRQVMVLRRGPHRVEFRMAEAAAAYRHRGDERRAASEPGDALEFLDREGRVAQRNMRRREKPILMARASLEGPCVVRPAKRVGQKYVVDFALPYDPQARVDNLRVDLFGVEKLHPRVHVLPLIVERDIAIEIVDREPGFLLAVARKDSEYFVDVAQLERLVVGDHHALAGGGVVRELERAVAKRRVDIALEQIQRFHEMAVAVDDLHRTTSEPVTFAACARRVTLSACTRVDDGAETRRTEI